jgi:hypothetical protein
MTVSSEPIHITADFSSPETGDRKVFSYTVHEPPNVEPAKDFLRSPSDVGHNHFVKWHEHLWNILVRPAPLKVELPLVPASETECDHFADCVPRLQDKLRCQSKVHILEQDMSPDSRRCLCGIKGLRSELPVTNICLALGVLNTDLFFLLAKLT